MTPLDELRADETRRWVEKAEDDFRLVALLESQAPGYATGTCFHAQQAVEKYVKAFLTLNRVEFPKTHDIDALIKIVAKKDPGLASDLSEAAVLGDYGVAARYPGDLPDVTEEQAERAISLARRVRSVIKEALPGFIPG